MKKYNGKFTELSADEAVMIIGGVDSSLKQLLYNIAYMVGTFIRLIFGAKQVAA